MGLPGIGVPVRAGGKAAALWRMEWTYTDGSGAVLLDTGQSDRHPDIASTAAVVDGGTGITNLRFPKCTRVWVMSKGLEPPTGDLADGTDYRHIEITERDADAGTANFRMVDIEGSGNIIDPTSGARGYVTLLLEFI